MVNLLLGKVAATRRSDQLTDLLSCCMALGISFKHPVRNWGKIRGRRTADRRHEGTAQLRTGFLLLSGK
jgi:hypothetical protein